MNSINLKGLFLVTTFSTTLIVSFQNCSKTAPQQIDFNSTNSSLAQMTELGIVNNNTNFGRIAALTVDQFNSQTAVLNSSGQVYLIRSDKKLYQMPGKFPLDQNKQIEIDPQNSNIFALLISPLVCLHKA